MSKKFLTIIRCQYDVDHGIEMYRFVNKNIAIICHDFEILRRIQQFCDTKCISVFD